MFAGQLASVFVIKLALHDFFYYCNSDSKFSYIFSAEWQTGRGCISSWRRGISGKVWNLVLEWIAKISVDAVFSVNRLEYYEQRQENINSKST